jgi:hypothetical protein
MTYPCVPPTAANEEGQWTMEQRKRIWIDPLQTHLAIRVVAYLLAYQVVVCAFIALCEQINSSLVSVGTGWTFLASGPIRTGFALLIFGPLLALDAVRFVHRLVGPLYRFRKTIQAIAEGQSVALVQLRKGDLLLDFKDDFNSMLKTLEEKGLVLIEPPGKAVSAETAGVSR